MTLKTRIKSFFQDVQKYSLYNSVNRLSFDGKSSHEYLKYSQISMYVNKAIDKRAEKVGETQFILRNTKTKEQVEQSPILDLINKPNPLHTGKQFWSLFQKYVDITGNAFIYLEKANELFDIKSVKAMWLLRPDLVKINYDVDGNVISYDYKKSNTTTVRYTKEEVLHFINPDPMNPKEGLSILKSGIRAIETEIQLGEYQANVLANGGKVEGIFRFKGGLTKTQVEEMKEKYAEEVAGARKVGRPLFLGGDAEYMNLALNPTELAYLESKKVVLNDICILTAVPKTVLGATGDETFANADASIAIFLRETIKPLIVSLRDFLDWRLIPNEYELDFIDPTPEDVDKKIKIVKTLYETDASTINERREMFGLEPVTNKEADQIMISFSKVPLGSKEMSDDNDNDDDINTKGVSKIHPLKDKSFRDSYRTKKLAQQDRNEAIMARTIKQYFQGQETRLIEHLAGIKEFKKKDLFSEMFDTNLEIRIAKGTVIPVLRKMMKEAGQDATELLNYDYGFNFTSSLEKWLDNRADLFAQQITKTTYDKLSNTFVESFESGETRRELIKRIQDVYDGYTEERATMIARTEVHGATQMANMEGQKQAGSPIKIWVSVLDNATRESHAFLDGEERPINDRFSNGLLFPGDPNGAPEETINCRCQA